MFRSLAIYLILFLGSSASHAAALTPAGATDLYVNGISYDVTFRDIACEDLWTPCGATGTNAIPFTFSTLLTVQAASEALLQLFELAGENNNPPYIEGCTSQTHCYIFTPYSTFTTSVISRSLLIGNGSNPISDGSSPFSLDFINNDQFVYADWQVSAVPVPAAIWLFGSALIGLIGFGKRKSVTA